MRTSIIACLGTLAVLFFTSASYACDACKTRAPKRHGCGLFGFGMCANCDDAPVVVGGPGIGCGCDGGACTRSCGRPCGSNCHRGGLICRLWNHVAQGCRCNGCGPKYIPEWHNRYCEPCNRCGDWTGPSIHHGRRYLGPPRSGSNIGVHVEHGTPIEVETLPAKPMPKATILPGTSVKRTSYTTARKPMPRHRRAAAPQTRKVRVIRVAPSAQRASSPVRGVIVD